jgi:adenosylmethionine-8-amino-7-oxononanoate aminotransferase
MLAGFTHEPVVALSEKLSALTGHELGHCFYASDGASAVEIALKMSFHFWRNTGHPGKNRFLSLAGSYHGETLGALAVTDVALFRDAYAPLLRACDTVPSPTGGWPARARRRATRRWRRPSRWKPPSPSTTTKWRRSSSSRWCNALPAWPCTTRNTCAARALCDHYGVHLIADEIAVGCGRTGSFFACEQADIVPDFLCLSKGITGGTLPLSWC